MKQSNLDAPAGMLCTPEPQQWGMSDDPVAIAADVAKGVTLQNSHNAASRVRGTDWLMALALSGVLALAGCAGEGPPSADQSAAVSDDDALHDDEPGLLQLSDESIALAGLQLSAAGPAVLQESISLYGTVRPNAERLRNVTARFPGVVRSVSVRVGDEVRQGATLAMVESNESLQTYAVSSPLRGVVTERFTNPGEQAESQPLFTVVDLSSVWVELSLYPRDRAAVRQGQRVQVQTTDGGISGEGSIVLVSALSAAQTQSLTARVVLDNSDGRWSPGLHVRGEVIVGDDPVDLAVPAAALQDIEGSTSIFVATDAGFQVRAVQLGRRDAAMVQVLSGLQAGERVVGEGSFVLKAELGKGEAGHDH